MSFLLNPYRYAGGGGGSPPSFGAMGTHAEGFGNISVAPPTHSEGDILTLVFTSRGNDSQPSTPSGWTLEHNGKTGTGSSHAQITVFTKTAGASEGNVTVADTGNQNFGVIFAVSGASSVALVTGATGTTSNDTAISISGGDTTDDDALVAVIVANGEDSASDMISSWTNGDITFTDRGGFNSTFASGGGVDVATGEFASTGTFGTTTATAASSDYYVGLHMEYLP